MVQEQIDRIKLNVKNALTAAAGKGVTVPENANSDDLPGLIDRIELGVKLPTLTTPASDAEVFEGKEYIKQDGSAGTGTFTLTNEISEQDALIAQIQEALRSKAVESIDAELAEQETLINTPLSALDEKTAASAPEMKMAYAYRNTMMTYIIVFPEGATWQDFIDSEYNAYASDWNVVSPMFIAESNGVAAYTGSDFIVTTDGESSGAVKLTDAITDGHIYQFYYVD